MTNRPQPPPWLDDAARAEWQRIVEGGDPGGLDRDVLAAYCVVHSSWLRAARQLRRRAEPRAAEDATLEHLERALTELAWALGIATGSNPERRPTRIVFVDEGPPDRSANEPATRGCATGKESYTE